MKNESIAHEKILEDVSHNLPNKAPTSAPRFDREAESHPGELETPDTVANSPDTFHHVLSAVQECQAKPPANFQRIVLILAPPDRARSQLAAAVAKRSRAKLMAAPSLPVSVGRRCSAAQIKGKAAALPYRQGWTKPVSMQRPVLVIDQGESLSRQHLDFLKLLINLTPVVLVVLATVSAYYRWRQSWSVEARQIHRRTHLVLERREERKWQ